MQVGFIGLGTMGASMAANLQKAGHALIVHDAASHVSSTTEPFARLANAPTAAVSSASYSPDVAQWTGAHQGPARHHEMTRFASRLFVRTVKALYCIKQP